MPSRREKIEKMYLIPCGGMDLSAEAVCRKSLTPGMDKVMDRLTQEVNPEPPPSAKLPKGLVSDDSGKLVLEMEEGRDKRLEKLIEEGKIRAEARHAIKQYQETLQGNSKLLQDITGQIYPR